MPANPKPRKGTAKRERQQRTKAARQRQHGGEYGHYIRAMDCLLAFAWTVRGEERWPLDVAPCFGPIQCARVRSRGAHPEIDAPGNCVPLCLAHHHEQHAGGIQTFQKKYGLDLQAIATRLGREWDDPQRED